MGPKRRYNTSAPGRISTTGTPVTFFAFLSVLPIEKRADKRMWPTFARTCPIYSKLFSIQALIHASFFYFYFLYFIYLLVLVLMYAKMSGVCYFLFILKKNFFRVWHSRGVTEANRISKKFNRTYFRYFIYTWASHLVNGERVIYILRTLLFFLFQHVFTAWSAFLNGAVSWRKGRRVQKQLH